LPEQRTVLTTGASGLLGANLVRYFADNSNCVGWYGTTPIEIAGALTFSIELTDHYAVSSSIDQIAPDVIVHCAAATDVEWCEKNPEPAKAINEEATENLAKITADLDIKFVFTSTDSVFDGRDGNYSEDSVPAPLNSYARGKARTEEIVTNANPDALIIRSYFYGHSPSGRRSLMEWVLNRALNGEEVPGFTDSYFSPISVSDFAETLDATLNSGTSGLLHLGSSNRISKYEFARLVMETYNCDMSLLRPITVSESNLKADRPRDTSLNVDLQADILGEVPPSVHEGIRKTAKEPNPFLA
tara:strand:- start:15395 stop:16297 length:903 start_codon:yes stop_codon:yes gene_type:complete